ncbi:MAG TPA: ferrous iron transport protein B [Symbiobacteriaceae bacterium]
MAQDCCGVAVAEVHGDDRKVVLVGNPNVGKSAVFHGLTGVYVEVSNFPGTTVDISSGRMGKSVIYDTPGVYGISAFNEEERVARDVLLQGDVVVNVVDACHLDRDLFLTVQLIDMGYPMVVALNMMDEARANGLAIDVRALSEELGVEVIPTVATRGQGIEELREAVGRARQGRRTPSIEPLLPSIPSPVDAVLVAEDDEDACRRHGVTPPGTREEVYRLRRERVNQIVARVVRETDEGASLATRLGRLTLHPVWGSLMLIAFLVAVYYILGVGIAQWVVGITEELWMGEYYIPWITELGSRVLAPESFLGQVLFGEFGLLTMTVSYIFGLLLPMVLGFYLMLSFMEDSGYLPRVAVLVDRWMNKVGLNGRAIIPTILGFGCVTMATMTTRLLGSQRERTIATFLLSLTIPCSAQMAVIATMLAPLGPAYFVAFGLILFLMYGLAGMLLNRLLPGESTPLLIDLPPMRLPHLGNVLRKTLLKTKMFITEAGPIFAAGSVLISVMAAWGILDGLQNALAPITVGWLGLPREAANAFIMGFVRRDFGAAGLYSLPLTSHQVMVALTTITLFVPCIASVMMILKERSTREGVLIWATDLVIAIFTGGIVHRILW